MSIIISDLSYHYPNQHPLFSHLNFSIANREKVSVIGDNGTGKSTLLKVIAGHLEPATGSIMCSSKPYYIPQHAGMPDQSVAEALGVDAKLNALESITKGSLLQADYDILDNDWDIESQCISALTYWGLPELRLDMPVNELSGGERTKVYLAGLLIHKPGIILLDEPSNDLDKTSRERLYQFVEQSMATIIVVSHDRSLLEQLPITYEISGQEIKRYGGNYSFYAEQKAIASRALSETIRAEEKHLRNARKKAQEVRERQEKRASHGAKNKAQIPRIVLNALQGSAGNTASRLGKRHLEIVNDSQSELAELKSKQGLFRELKIDFDNATLHSGKLLIEAVQVNYAFSPGTDLWQTPLDFKLYSHDRVHVEGNNGAGKTTFIRLLAGILDPSGGQINRTDFTWIYLDQHYEQVHVDCTVEQLAESYNLRKLEDHEIKIRLNRFLFPFDTWDKHCKSLSGGEKMRLYLCCLMISNQTPDLIILDEPTNNLDIASLQILSQTIKDYKGSLLVVSHDQHFVREIETNSTIYLER